MGKVYPASKVIVNNEVMLDVTNTTATTKEIAKGFRIVSATGAEIEGTLHTQIFVAKIFNGVIEVVPEGFSPDWFGSANEAKEAYLMNEDLELRDGDFLILETYFSYSATDSDIALTGLPQRETYVYQEEQHHWLTIGASTLCDNATIELINGQVSLKNALNLEIEEDAEYIPYLQHGATGNELAWMRSDNVLEKLAAIESFFAENPELDGISDTLIEITEKIDNALVLQTEFTERCDSIEASVESVENNLQSIDDHLSTFETSVATTYETKANASVQYQTTLSSAKSYTDQQISKCNQSLTNTQQELDQLKETVNDIDSTANLTYKVNQITQLSHERPYSNLEYDLIQQARGKSIINIEKSFTVIDANNYLNYLYFNMANANSDIYVYTSDNIRCQPFLKIIAHDNHTITIEGQYSGIEIVGNGKVVLKNVSAISQIGSKKQHGWGHNNANVHGMAGIAIKGKLTSPSRLQYDQSYITLIIDGNVYCEGARNADGLAVYDGYAIIMGDTLTAIGNHGVEKSENSTFPSVHTNLFTQETRFYDYVLDTSYGASQHCFIKESWDITDIDYLTCGSGIGLANGAAKEVIADEYGSYYTPSRGYYISEPDKLGLSEDDCAHGVGRIMLTGLKKVVAYGYGAGACGIGGGISPKASDRDNFGLMIEGVQELHAKGGFAASEFIVEHSKNKPDYQIGWDVGREEGGPGIGFTIRQKYLDCGFVDIKDTHIISCLGGTRSSGIGNGLTSKANVRITNSIIDLVKGGAGGAAIGGGSLYLNCGVGQSEDSSVFVKIIGSVITGYGGEYGPIIGSGYYVKRKYNDRVMPVTTIEIDSSIVSGMPGRLAAGIGSGNLGGLVSGYISKDSLMHIELNREADNDTWQEYSLKPFAQATLFGHGVTDLFEGNTALLEDAAGLKQWFETGVYPYKLIYKRDRRKAYTNEEYVTMEPYKHTLETIAWMTSYLAKYIDTSTGNGEAYVYFYDPAQDFSNWNEDQLKDFFIDENNDSLHDIPSNIPWTAEVSAYNKHFIRLKYSIGYGDWVDEDYPSSPWTSGWHQSIDSIRNYLSEPMEIALKRQVEVDGTFVTYECEEEFQCPQYENLYPNHGVVDSDLFTAYPGERYFTCKKDQKSGRSYAYNSERQGYPACLDMVITVNTPNGYAPATYKPPTSNDPGIESLYLVFYDGSYQYYKIWENTSTGCKLFYTTNPIIINGNIQSFGSRAAYYLIVAGERYDWGDGQNKTVWNGAQNLLAQLPVTISFRVPAQQ